MNKRLKFGIATFFLALFFMGLVPLSQASVVNVPLQDHLSLITYSYTAADNTVTKTDFMLDGHYWYSSMGESVWSNNGESSAGVGTSYLDLGLSALKGDYAGYPYSWSDFAYLTSSFGSTVTKVSGDSAWTVGTNCSFPSLSAGATSSYIRMQMAGAANALTGANEEITFTAETWHDYDGDNVDDSATVTSEDFIPFTQNTYIFGTAMVDASDIDKDAHGYIQLGLYVDSSTTYDLRIEFQGGEIAADSSYVASWNYTDEGTAYDSILSFYEAEGEKVSFLIDLADLISDDTDSTPVISGLDFWKMGIYAEDAYGDDDADTIDFYVYNLAILDEIPCITDNDAASDWDINQAANIAIYGEDDYYLSHDSLQPVVSAATDNEFNTYIYLDKDFDNGDYLFNNWRHVTFAGTGKLEASAGDINTALGTGKNRRDVQLTFNHNQMRIYEGRTRELSSTYTPTISTQAFVIKTDNDDFYSSEGEYDQDLIEDTIWIDGKDEYQTFVQALANVNDNTWVTLKTFGAVDTDGETNLEYSYYTEERGDPKDPDDPVVPILPRIFGISSAVLIGGLVTIGLAVLMIRKRK